MPKNQFQRPLQVNHSHNVPRHGKPPVPVGKRTAKALVKMPIETLPPLAALLEMPSRK